MMTAHLCNLRSERALNRDGSVDYRLGGHPKRYLLNDLTQIDYFTGIRNLLLSASLSTFALSTRAFLVNLMLYSESKL